MFNNRLFFVFTIILTFILPSVAIAQDEVFPTNTPITTLQNEVAATAETTPIAIITTAPGETTVITIDQPASTAVDNSEILTAVVIGGTLIILGILLAGAYLMGITLRAFFQALPPVVQELLRALIEMLVAHAATTPTQTDDEVLDFAIAKLGMIKQVLPDGRVVLTHLAAPPTENAAG